MFISTRPDSSTFVRLRLDTGMLPLCFDQSESLRQCLFEFCQGHPGGVAELLVLLPLQALPVSRSQVYATRGEWLSNGKKRKQHQHRLQARGKNNSLQQVNSDDENDYDDKSEGSSEKKPAARGVAAKPGDGDTTTNREETL